MIKCGGYKSKATVFCDNTILLCAFFIKMILFLDGGSMHERKAG
jgi:hypothetical protein